MAVRLLALLVAVCCVAGAVQGTNAAAGTDEPALEVSVQDGRLTTRLLAARLSDVLRAIADRAGIPIKLQGDLTAPVTAEFTSVPLDEGLRRLTAGHSICVLYDRPGPPGRGVLGEVWVIEGRHPSVAGAGVALYRRSLWISQVDMLAGRGDAAALQALARVLTTEEDAVVRARAVGVLDRFPDADADPVLASALENDPDAAVRRTAAHALSGRVTPAAREALQRASADPDRGVRQEATRALRGAVSPATTAAPGR